MSHHSGSYHITPITSLFLQLTHPEALQLNQNMVEYSTINNDARSITLCMMPLDGYAEGMKEIVNMKRLRFHSNIKEGLACVSLLTAGIETDKVVDNAGRATSYKCCVPFATLAAIEHSSGRSLSDDFIANNLNNVAPVLAQKIRTSRITMGDEDPYLLSFEDVMEELGKSNKVIKGMKYLVGGGEQVKDIRESSLFDEIFRSNERSVAVLFLHEDDCILFAKRGGESFCEVIDTWPHDNACGSPGRLFKVQNADVLENLIISIYRKRGKYFTYYILTDEPNGPSMLNNQSVLVSGSAA